nr:MAG TPA_asm: hypothetical protein [Caudoviricetes sp.]DAP76334.1 MAG TPA: hypothetical protein [Caudoviricetes sp.]
MLKICYFVCKTVDCHSFIGSLNRWKIAKNGYMASLSRCFESL